MSRSATDHAVRLRTGLDRAHARQITRRLPLFAALWLGLTVVWDAVEVAGSPASPLVVIVDVTIDCVVLALALAICRRSPEAPRVQRVVLAMCLLLGLGAAVEMTFWGGYGEVLAFSLLLISLTAALLFAWGWVNASILVIGDLVIWEAARSGLRLFVAPEQLAVGFLFGSVVTIAVAEVTARNLRKLWHQGHARRRAMRKLAASREAYRDLAENASDLIYKHDLQGRITYVNEAFAHYAGIGREALIGVRTLDLIDHSRPNPDVAALIARVARGEAVPPVTLAVKTDQGERWIECVASGVRDAEGRVTGLRGIARDVTARVRAEEALRASYEEIRRREEDLSRLARRQSAIREEERKRLGVDLHDGVCQELVAIGIDLEMVRTEMEVLPARVASRLDRVGRYVGSVIEHLRLLAHDLRPMVLLDLGLEESLRALARGMSSNATRVTASFTTTMPTLEEDTALGVYRIAQEALANALRHAGARIVALTLGAEAGSLRLEVRDDGRGFVADTGRPTHTIGMVSMEERARALGGRLEVRSAPGEGTVVTLDCPMQFRASTAA